MLVEDSIVRQGNGMVIGTSSDADFQNITFRNCTAIGTAFGCHIKFKEQQVGRPGVRDILFENITIVNPTRYAIGASATNGIRSAPHGALLAGCLAQPLIKACCRLQHANQATPWPDKAPGLRRASH